MSWRAGRPCRPLANGPRGQRTPVGRRTLVRMGGRPLLQEPRWAPSSFVAGLSAAQRADLLSLRPPRTVPARTIVLLEGDDRSRYLAVLLAGFVKITTVAMGEEVALAIRGPGDLLGEAFVLGDSARQATVTALGTLTYLAIPEPEFVGFLRREPAGYRALAATLSARLRWANRRRAEAVAFTPPVRLARLLVDLAEEYGRPGPAGVELAIPLTQTDLASMISLSTPAVEKASRSLREERLLQSGRGRRVIDLEGLRAFGDPRP